jgi:ABC-type amino acid transport system permease subunit
VIYWLCSYGMSRYAGRIERRLAVNPSQTLDF